MLHPLYLLPDPRGMLWLALVPACISVRSNKGERSVVIKTTIPGLMEATAPLRERLHVPVAFKYRDFRNYWFGLLASVVGYQMLVNFSLLWLIYDLTHDARYQGYVGASIAVPAIALNLFGGVLADKLNTKRLLGLTQFIKAALVVVLAALVLGHVINEWHVLAIACLVGAVQAFDGPSRQSLYPRLIEPKALPNAVALNSLLWTGTRIVSPAIAGMIIGRSNISAAILVSAAGFLALALVSQTLRLPAVDRARGTLFKEMFEGFLFIKRTPIFAYLIGMTFFNSIFGMSYIFLMPVFAEEVLEVGAEKIGWLMGASGAGAVTGILVSTGLSRSQSKGWLIIGGAVFFGAFLALFGLVAHLQLYELSMVVLFVAGLFNSVYQIGVLTTLQVLVPNSFRGRVMGFYGMAWSITALGALQSGQIAHYLSAPAAVAIGGAVVVAFALVVTAFSSRVRSIGAPVSVEAEGA